MATDHGLLSEDELLCSICLNVFTKPVSIPCGHNFCKSCITEYWSCDGVANWRCPLCKRTSVRKPDLEVNTLISELAIRFNASVEVGDTGSSPDEPLSVVCDICAEVKAFKSCLDCLASYCETHLQPHRKFAGLKRHNLIDPVDNLEDRICKEHNRLLTLFCRKDLVCLCEVCAETSHRTHETGPLQEEYEQRKAQLGKTEARVQLMIQERLQKVQEIKDTVKLSQKEAEIELAKIVAKQKATEKEAKEHIKDLEREITDLKETCTELKQLLQTEDHLHLLQNLPTQSILPQAKERSRISLDSCEIMSLSLLLSEECTVPCQDIVVLSEAELQSMQQHEVDVILDPDTAQCKLYLSRDGKQVTYSPERRALKLSLKKRFDNYLAVLGKRGYSSRKFYFEVQVGKKDEWILGVASKGVIRKEPIISCPESGFWTVGFRVDRFEACTDPREPVHGTKAHTVGVFVDYDEGEVSFYDVENRALIYSFTGYTFTEELYPFLNPCDDEFPTNLAPLIISPVNQRK